MSRGISAPRHPYWTKDLVLLKRRTINHMCICPEWVEDARDAGFTEAIVYPIRSGAMFEIGLRACEYMLARTSGRAAATWSRRAGILRGELERMSTHG